MAKQIRIAADRSKVKVRNRRGQPVKALTIEEARRRGKQTRANLNKGMSLAEAKRAAPSRSFDESRTRRESATEPSRGTEPPR